MSDKYFEVKNEKGEIIVSNLTSTCISCKNNRPEEGTIVDCPLFGNKRRNGEKKTRNGFFFLCSNNSKTSKLFRSNLNDFATVYPYLKLPISKIEYDIREKEQKRINRLLHNLISIQGRNLQEVYLLIPQDDLTSNFDHQLKYVTRIIKENPVGSATTLLRLLKFNLQMKSEFSIYRKLERVNPTLEKRLHPIHKVLMNVLHSFFIDFSDKDVFVEVGDCRSKVICDYETVQVAFYHMVENAVKYVKPKSRIQIEFSNKDSTLEMTWKMKSLYINPEEYEKLFVEGYSGIEAKRTLKDGDGIGLWRIKQMLALNEFDIHLVPGKDIDILNSFKFATNIFIITMKL